MTSKPTLEDVAKLAKVSRMTVSRVFSSKNNVSEETANRIKKIAQDLGYHPNLIARSLSNKKAMTIGVFVPKTKNLFYDIYITQILSGISDVTQELNYRILFLPIDRNGDLNNNQYISIARSHLVDGIILIKTKKNDEGLDDLVKINFPFVLVNHRSTSKNYNYVDTCNSKGAEIAVEYLHKLGHRKIAFVTGSMDETNAIDRLKGYKNKIKELGLAYKEEWIISGDFSQEKAYQESKKLFGSSNLPTAIFCSDDYMAIGVMNRIRELGLSVPGDISIIGFDDIEIASYIHPPLTTIRQPMYNIGKRSTEILLDLINKKIKPPFNELLDVELIVRESTARRK